MRTLTKLALTASLALAMALTFSCSGDGDDNPPPAAVISSSSGGGGSSSSGVSSSGGGSSSSVSSSSYVCESWTEEVTTVPTCANKGVKTLTCASNPSDTKTEEIAKLEYDQVKYECRTGKIYLKGGLTDSRGGTDKTYDAVLIGTQTWMAENLNYNASGSKCGDESTGTLKNENTSTCATYGRLYNWYTARDVCPPGWHLPNKDEWDALKSFIESDQSCSNCDAKHLKSPTLWNGGTGLDTYGFSALPGGYGGYSDGNFRRAGNEGFWWIASESSRYDAFLQYMDCSYEYASYFNNDKSFLFSVRCLKD